MTFFRVFQLPIKLQINRPTNYWKKQQKLRWNYPLNGILLCNSRNKKTFPTLSQRGTFLKYWHWIIQEEKFVSPMFNQKLFSRKWIKEYLLTRCWRNILIVRVPWKFYSMIVVWSRILRVESYWHVFIFAQHPLLVSSKFFEQWWYKMYAMASW